MSHGRLHHRPPVHYIYVTWQATSPTPSSLHVTWQATSPTPSSLHVTWQGTSTTPSSLHMSHGRLHHRPPVHSNNVTWQGTSTIPSSLHKCHTAGYINDSLFIIIPKHGEWLLNTKCVFWFSLQICLKMFLILRRTEWDSVFIVPTGTLRLPWLRVYVWLPWLRVFRAFFSVVRQMPGYISQRRGTARTLPNYFDQSGFESQNVFQPNLLIVLFYVLFVCKCVLYYCQRVSTQLQLIIISYHISYLITIKNLYWSSCKVPDIIFRY